MERLRMQLDFHNHSIGFLLIEKLLLGQAIKLQLRNSIDRPVHSFPPLAASRTFDLSRVSNPPPHVLEHRDQLENMPHLQSITCGADMKSKILLIHIYIHGYKKGESKKRFACF